jgi:hypothetical protein
MVARIYVGLPAPGAMKTFRQFPPLKLRRMVVSYTWHPDRAVVVGQLVDQRL